MSAYPARRWSRFPGGINQMFKRCPDCGAAARASTDDVLAHDQWHAALEDRLDAFEDRLAALAARPPAGEPIPSGFPALPAASGSTLQPGGGHGDGAGEWPPFWSAAGWKAAWRETWAAWRDSMADLAVLLRPRRAAPLADPALAAADTQAVDGGTAAALPAGRDHDWQQLDELIARTTRTPQ